MKKTPDFRSSGGKIGLPGQPARRARAASFLFRADQTDRASTMGDQKRSGILRWRARWGTHRNGAQKKKTARVRRATGGDGRAGGSKNPALDTK